MQKHPVLMTRIDDLPVSVYEDGSIEIMDEHSGVPVTLSREKVEEIVAVSRQSQERRRGLRLAADEPCRFPPPWSVEESAPCINVRAFRRGILISIKGRIAKPTQVNFPVPQGSPGEARSQNKPLRKVHDEARQ